MDTTGENLDLLDLEKTLLDLLDLEKTLLDLLDLEKTWRYWRKPGEDLEILEKTWSFFVNLWLTEGKIDISYTLQTLTSYVFLQFSR